MTKVQVHILSAFADEPHGGNKAGVVIDADSLSNSDMQRVAHDVSLSETAFIKRSEIADRKLQFFTPNSEVDLCGHATVAAYSLLFARSLIGVGKFTHELNAGALGIEVASTGEIIMNQSLPRFGGEITPAEIASILNIPMDWMNVDNLMPQIVSTGLPDILVPIDSRAHLFQVKPNYAAMKEFNLSTHTTGFHLFTLDTISSDSTAHCRNFAPAYDILEEPATGSSSGAHACYLQKHLLPAQSSYTFEQGFSMDRPSKISAELTLNGTEITSVTIKGRAIEIDEITVSLEA